MRPCYVAPLMLLLALAPVALGADGTDLGASPWVELALKTGIPTAGLGGVIYWLLRYHLPSLIAAFEASLKTVVDDHKATRAEDREYHDRAIAALKESVAAEGRANREHREQQSDQLRSTLAGLARLRPDDDREHRRRTAG